MSSSSRTQPLAGKVALVTGASRGVGKGVAVQLGEAGATVYITARTLKPREGTLPGLGSLLETADEIKRRGGRCVPVKCDHEKDNEILELFQQIGREQNNRLDILVNCAFKGVSTMFNNPMLTFWEMKPEVWDDINNVGLRNNYICSVYAARMMVPAKQGLIINISSMGGMRYLFNVPYGTGKAALDRMSKDCGIELKAHNVTCLSLYPGAVKTELVKETIEKQSPSIKVGCGMEIKMSDFFKNAETPEFTGKVVVALAQDPKLMSYNSQVLMVADYAQAHSIRDIDNRQIASVRQLWFLAQMVLPDRLQYFTKLIPGFIKVPNFMLTVFNSRF